MTLFELKRPGAHLEEGDGRRVVDEQLRLAHLLRREEERLFLFFRQATLAQALKVHARLGALDTETELLGGHFEREEADDVLLMNRQIRGDIERERGLPHTRAGRDDDEVGLLETLGEGVEARVSRRQAREHRAATVDVLDLDFVLLGNRRKLHEAAADRSLRDLHEIALRVLEDGLGVRGRDRIANRAPRLEDDEAPERGLAHETRVALDILDVGHPVDERREDGRAACPLEPPGLLELALHHHEVHALAPVREREARLVDEPVRLARKILRHEELHDARQERAVDEDRAQEAPLGVGTRGENFGAGGSEGGHRGREEYRARAARCETVLPGAEIEGWPARLGAAHRRGGDHPVPVLLVQPARSDALSSLRRAVVVRSGRLEKALALGEGRERVFLLSVLVGVYHLEAVQAGDDAEGDDPLGIAVPDRMRDHRQTARLANGRDRLLECPLRLRHVSRLAPREKSLERFVERFDVSLGDHRPRDVRAAEGTLADHDADLLDVERHPEGEELLDHRVPAGVAVPTESNELRPELGLVGIEEEAEDVDVVPVAARRELARGHGHEAGAFRRGLEFGQAVDGIVIGQREDRDARVDAPSHELRGRLQAVRERRVAVKIGTPERGHQCMVAAGQSAPSGTLPA